MIVRFERLGMDFCACINAVFNPSCVVSVSCLLSVSFAVGPTIIFPCVVGETKTPFPISVGSWKSVAYVRFPHILSINIYSPFRAITLYFVEQILLFILSEKIPAQLTTTSAL